MSDKSLSSARPVKKDTHPSKMMVGLLVYAVITSCTCVVFYQYYKNEIQHSYAYGKHLEWLCIKAEKFANIIYAIDKTYTERTTTTKITELGTTDGARIFVNFSDSFLILFCLLSAMFFWPGNIIKKVFAIILAGSLMLGANIIRIASILWFDVHWPLLFSYGQLMITVSYLLLAILLFIVWVRFSGKHPMIDPLHKIW